MNNKLNQPSKFRTKDWAEINDDSREIYNACSSIRFKISMLKSSLCDYNDAYIPVKGTITITRTGADTVARQADERDRGIIFKTWAQFTKCISK